jgi:hypothetical protein
VSFEPDRGPFPLLVEPDARGGRFADRVSDVRGWRDGRAFSLLVNLSSPTACQLAVCGDPGGELAAVLRDPLVGVPVCPSDAVELCLDSLHVGLMAGDPLAHVVSVLPQLIARSAIAPPERLGLVLEPAGVLARALDGVRVLLVLALQPHRLPSRVLVKPVERGPLAAGEGTKLIV